MGGILNEDITPEICFSDCWGITCTPHQYDWAWGLCSALQGFFERDAVYWNMFIKTFSAQWCKDCKYISRKSEQEALDAMLKLVVFCASFTGQPVIKVGPMVYHEQRTYFIKPGLQIIIEEHLNDKIINGVAVDVKGRTYMNVNEWLSAYQPDNNQPKMKTINTFTV